MARAPEANRNPALWLIVLRMALAGLMLGGLLAWQYSDPHASFPFRAANGILAGAFVLSLLAALLHKTRLPASRLLYGQLVGDTLLITGLVYVTGGAGSPFAPAYNLVIIAASTLLARRGGYTMAALASILYGGLSDLQYYRLIPPFDSFQAGDESTVFLNVSLNVLAFFLIAFLGGSLSQRLQQAHRELEASQRNLLDLQAYTKDVLKSMTSGLVTTDLDGRLKSYNRAAEEILGQPLGKHLGRFLWELMPISEMEAFLRSDRLRRLGSARFNGTVARPDGETRTLGMTVSPLKNRQGDTVGAIAIFQDLTQIKAMEEAMRKKEQLALIGELAAGIAHEIRNPLASLSGSIQLLRQDLPLGEDDRRLMDIVLRETERLNRIVSDFLAYARPRVPQLKETDIHELLRRTLELLEKAPSSQDAKVQIVLDLQAQNPCIPVDPGQMEQVFWNLCLNALEAMPQGGTLTVRTRWLPGGQTLEILFQDTGKGIPPWDLDRIFLPFFTTKEQGSGLGLANVYRIVNNHGGYVGVESWPGQGTTFRVQLLREIPQEKRAQAHEAVHPVVLQETP